MLFLTRSTQMTQISASRDRTAFQTFRRSFSLQHRNNLRPSRGLGERRHRPKLRSRDGENGCFGGLHTPELSCEVPQTVEKKRNCQKRNDRDHIGIHQLVSPSCPYPLSTKGR